MRKSTAILLAALILLSAVSGIWLIVSPSFERRQSLERQDEMIAEIEETIDAAAIQPEIEAPFLTVLDDEPEPIVIAEPAPPKEPAPIGAELGILMIERLDMKLPVVEGVTEELLKTAVGHVPETAAIGDMGNAVIAGHRSYAYGKDFNRLGEVGTGDIIAYISADGENHLFEVFEIIEIEPDDQIAFIQTSDRSIITLYTCTPIYEATHRLLVRAGKI